ncbi:MAG: HesA/MoeB/ThiF family protein [Deltaproteobacteria bacterium]|nr:HesA/MoeB/ThiF family protein [Deltaproteobacteria bacterium]
MSASALLPGRVLLIGAGGLGCGAALTLVAAGLAELTVLDDDLVDESNLHRQVLHTDAFIGHPKVDSIAGFLRKRFPQTAVTPRRERFSTLNAAALVAAHDVVLDGSDNLETKFLVNDACVLGGKAFVHAAAVGTMGQLITVPAGGRPCYRCLFEELPSGADAPNCAEAGVLGPVPGVLGSAQANEAIRLLCGKTPAFSGRLIRYDSPAMTMRTITFRRNPACRVCGDAPAITGLDARAYGAPACQPLHRRSENP